MWRVSLALVFAAALAHADPGKSRIVLADPDPALRAAVERTLSPWRIEVVVDQKVPTSQASADDLARTRDAHFVVWREGGELVVLDRRRNAIEHREARVGTLAPADAAAAALTVKTLMRLEGPPPEPQLGSTGPAPSGSSTTAAKPPIVAAAEPPAIEPPVENVDEPPPVPVVPEAEPEIVVQLGFGTRAAAGTDAGVRGIGTVLVQPWTIPLRVGITGDLGSSTDVRVSSFRGTWSDWSLVATASYAIAIERWEIEPFAGAGVARSRLSGLEMGETREETATLAALRAGTWVRWRTGRWSVGGILSGDVSAGAPAYTGRSGMSDNSKPIFAIPSVALTVGAFVSADFGL